MSESAPALLGRREIVSAVDAITDRNITQVLARALGVHHMNAGEIDYLYKYAKGQQPILSREKTIRPEINNKVVENHASEIVNFTSAYFMGDPVTYVRRGDRESASADVERLNDFMFFEDKASHDKEMATWMAICGVGYRMVLPDANAGASPDLSPFEIDTLDPRRAFVVYHSGFGHRRLMGVIVVPHETADGNVEVTYACYTPDMYYEVKSGVVINKHPHLLGDIPIFEYRLNMERMGSFEPAIPLLDAINKVASNRLDGIEQFVQSFLKFKNCEVSEDNIKKLPQLGAISVRSENGVDADVDIISQELDQTQVQTLVDYLYDQVLVICGLPMTAKSAAASTSDTGQAVYLRNGWQNVESRARSTELLWKKSEKEFLRLVLRIMNNGSGEGTLNLAEVECKFTRRQHDNLLTKTQSLLHMLESGLHPEIAIAASGLFNDPMDVYQQSIPYLKKWDFVELAPAEDDTDETPESV